MLHHLPLPLLFLLALALPGCSAQDPNRSPEATAESGPPPPKPSAAVSDSIDWAGTYFGIVPVGTDKEAVETVLILHPDTTYTVASRSVDDRSPAERHSGPFSWEPDGRSIKLLDIDSTNRPIYYEVGDRYVKQMDLINVPIEGSMSRLYYLEKDESGLLEKPWDLIEIMGKPVAGGKRVPSFTLSANGNRITGFAGCNTFQGTYTLGQHGLSFPPLAATKMACPELELEQQFFDALRATLDYGLSGDTLTLLNNRKEAVAVFRSES